MNKTYLQHFGIKGQKWGDRNGPPYPLDASQASASEKRAGFSERYTEQQYRRDRRVYGTGAAKRIKRHVDRDGESVQGARSYEADRNFANKRAATRVGNVVTAAATAAYFVSPKYRQVLNTAVSRITGGKDPVLDQWLTYSAVGVLSTGVGTAARYATRIAGGYKISERY